MIVEKAPLPVCSLASSRSQEIAPRFRRIGALEHGADDGAAVLTLPGRADEMAPHDLAAPIEELGLRRLEGPDEYGGVIGLGFAGVDLDTTSAELEEEHGAGRWRQNRRYVLGAGGGSLSGY